MNKINNKHKTPKKIQKKNKKMETKFDKNKIDIPKQKKKKGKNQQTASIEQKTLIKIEQKCQKNR